MRRHKQSRVRDRTAAVARRLEWNEAPNVAIELAVRLVASTRMAASSSSIAVPPRRRAAPFFRPFQLATLATKLPRDDGWPFEMKFDGYRCQAEIISKTVRLYTRRGHHWTDKFAWVLPALQSLTGSTVLIDGEICALDAEGRPDFSLLNRRSGPAGRWSFMRSICWNGAARTWRNCRRSPEKSGLRS